MELTYVDERRNRNGDRVWVETGEGSLRSLPRQWTSLWTPDAFELASAGRAWFRPDDLIRLVELIASTQEQLKKGKEEQDV